ncbi:MAG: membrane dipeptidase, partial [Gemmatimonadaceae bacterium]
FWNRELAAHPDVWMQVRTIANLRAAKESKKVGIILGFQDATMYENDLARVDLFHDMGVRIAQLTYNGRNLVGDGCLERANAGLSNFGRTVVERLNSLGSLVDLSHCGRQTTTDGIMNSTKPVAITHSGCSAIADVPRNKPDEILRRLADRGGVVGIYLMPFLRVTGQPMAEDFMRHLTHALDICGEDHVGVGSDNSITPIELTPEFRAIHRESIMARRARGISAPGEDPDVFTYVPDINSPRRLDLIADLMAKKGHGSARIAKVIGGNWARLLGEVWG